MVKKAVNLCLVTVAFAAMTQGLAAQENACTVKPGDEAALVDTVRGMYAAATVDDRPKVKSYFAPGFYMFDGGQRFDGDAIMDAIEGYYKQGVKFVWNVTRPDVHIHCNQAWIAYVNEGSILMPGASAPTPTKWLESVVLERQDGMWKMVFFHSTRVTPPPSPEPAK
jgi:hypothetical protein